MNRTVVLALTLFANIALAHPADPVTRLIQEQTDLGSNAGQQGDQKTVDRLTDDYILFSAGDGAVQRDEKLDAKDALADELLEYTRALHGPRNAAARQYVARPALFVDETGARNQDSDFRGGAATVSQWVVHHDHNVAVASFILQAGESRFLAVETWNFRASHWKLMGGQTIPLYVDPPAVDLSENELDDYVGTYSAGAGSLAAISRDGKALSVTIQGSKPIVLRPSARDRFFIPDQPTGYVRPSTDFRRNADGRVIGYVRNGIEYTRVDNAAPDAPLAMPEPGPLKLRDFVVLHTDDVAIATFFHDRDTPYYGQVLHQTFHSMETWVKRGSSWKMISSQGCQVYSPDNDKRS